MDFSGERFMEGVGGQTTYEHLHRYRCVLDIVDGRDVLDLASGSGYGSALMAERARSVIGVDISKEAIDHANQREGKPKNLKYRVGSASKLEFDARTFDVVVSFETIEHLLEQEKMISEIRRVLRDDGFLIISSPNRDVYSDKFNQNNPFHLKELNFIEFDNLLSVKFCNRKYFCQRQVSTSMIYPMDKSPNSTGIDGFIIDQHNAFSNEEPAIVDPVYFIAICSDQITRVPIIKTSVLFSNDDPISRELLDLSDSVVERDQRIAALYKATDESHIMIETLQQAATRLSEDVVERDQRIAALYKATDESHIMIETLQQAATRLSEDVVERDRRLADLYPAIAKLEDTLRKRELQVLNLYETIEVKDRHLDELAHIRDLSIQLTIQLEDKTNQIANLERSISSHESEKAEIANNLRELQNQLAFQKLLISNMEDEQDQAESGLESLESANYDLLAQNEFMARQISQLQITENTLRRVLSSRTWQALRFYRAIRRPRRTLNYILGRLRSLRSSTASSSVLSESASVSSSAAGILSSAKDVRVNPWVASRQLELLRASNLFDENYYLTVNKDVAISSVSPIRHYMRHGAFEGRNPNEYFDTRFYLEKNSDVLYSKINPLVHYHLYGEAERRAPSEKFDPGWYLDRYSDVREAGLNALEHFLHYGRAEGRQPSPNLPVDISALVESLPADYAKYFDRLSSYESWQEVNRWTSAREIELRDMLAQRRGRLPKISLITPTYNTDPALLRELAATILDQVEDGWEWCIVDDGSSSPHMRDLLAEIGSLDARIRVALFEVNEGISVATNKAVEMSTGDIIAFVDHDDLVSRDCIAELAIYYADHPETDVAYSDDDKIDLDGKRFAPQFKPDWSPALLTSFMYFGHIFSVKRALFLALGGFRSAFDGSQDFDFALRATERAHHVGHIPRVLYHWRVVPGSTAESGDAKPASLEAGRLAVQEAFDRRALNAEVYHPDWAMAAKVGMFAPRFAHEGPEVTIIIPTYNQWELLKVCLESLAQTQYKPFKVVVIDNDSDEPETLRYLKKVAQMPGHAVLRIGKDGRKFNFARLMNQAVRKAETELVLLLNNDTAVRRPDWLSQMVGWAQEPDVGAVGARLYFADGNIQHAGIVHGYNEGLVGHAFRNAPAHDWGYMGFIRTTREYSAVTAACLLTKRSIFESVGGFDEDNFAVAYNDVDLGYRLSKSGYRSVYCPDAELFHFEGKSRPKNDDPREIINLRRIYGEWHDKYYNPNLTLADENFGVANITLPTRRHGPVNVVFFSHNLQFQGAPITLFDLVCGLVTSGHVQATVMSPDDGPLRAAYEAAGVSVLVFTQPPLNSGRDAFLTGCAALGKQIVECEADVVVANTLDMFFATTSAQMVGLATIWCQHESQSWQTYFNYISPDVRGYAYAAFGQAYRVTYVAEATRRSWSELQTRGNFELIRHGLPAARIQTERDRWTRTEARSRLGVGDGEIVILLAGTVCERKGQRDLAQAVAELNPAMLGQIRVFVAGALTDLDYVTELKAAAEHLADRFIVTGAVEDMSLYYKAADIYVCTSRIESAPRVLVEAMAFGLPIITTPVFGIPEIVDEGINARFYTPGAAAELAGLLATFIAPTAERHTLGEASDLVLRSKPSFDDMVKRYNNIIRQAALLKDEAFESA